MVSCVQLGYSLHIGVLSEDVGELRDGEGARLTHPVPQTEPEIPILALVKQPGAEGFFLLLLPGVGGPSALTFSALDEGDVFAGFDDVDAGLHDGPIAVWPMRGNLSDGCGPVTLKPGGLGLASGHLSGEYNLERPLA